MNFLGSLVVKFFVGIVNKWRESINLRRQGAQEQRLHNQETNNEKLADMLDAHNDSSGDEHGMRDSDYRD